MAGRRVLAALSAGLTAAATTALAVPAQADDHENLAGEPTITLPINDSAAGGTYDQDFTRAYAGETPDGTPVYIYVPEGTPLDGTAPTGVPSLDPQFDHDPDDAFVPCAEEFALTQAQIDYMGDTLADQIVAVDEAHFGEMGAADPGEPASDSLVMVVYNIHDELYYDCAYPSYTVGYFAPDFINSAGIRTTPSGATMTRPTTGPSSSRAPWPTSWSTCCTTTATRASCPGSTRAWPTSPGSSTASMPGART